MNCDIPYLRCWVRNEFTTGGSGAEEAYAFAIQCYPGRALAFHVMLKSGAHYRGVPIHGIALSPDAPPRALGDCQLWDCFSLRPIVTVFSYLQDHEATCYTRGGPVGGVYLFTVDWLPESWERPGFTLRPEQNKCAHVFELADGNLAALPTNRIAWRDAYFIGSSPNPRGRGYKVQEEIYQAEDSGWDVSTSQDYFYGPKAESGMETASGPDRPSCATPGPFSGQSTVCEPSL
jgi:hypothetical protein